MTNEQRDEVVELLRLAADEDPQGGPQGLWDVEDGYDIGCQNAAYGAYRDLVIETGYVAPATDGDGQTFRWHLLEAAARVEDGTWSRPVRPVTEED